jgi:hypothetical protein
MSETNVHSPCVPSWYVEGQLHLYLYVISVVIRVINLYPTRVRISILARSL